MEDSAQATNAAVGGFFTKKLAVMVFITLSVGVTLFHLLILSGIIPFDMVWGGRLKSASEMLAFEVPSIALNLLFIVIIFLIAGYIPSPLPPKVLRVIAWIMAGFFMLNTLGNLLSNSGLERIIFTPVTILLAVCSYRFTGGMKRS
jgi:hypothetical protein